MIHWDRAAPAPGCKLNKRTRRMHQSPKSGLKTSGSTRRSTANAGGEQGRCGRLRGSDATALHLSRHVLGDEAGYVGGHNPINLCRDVLVLEIYNLRAYYFPEHLFDRFLCEPTRNRPCRKHPCQVTALPRAMDRHMTACQASRSPMREARTHRTRPSACVSQDTLCSASGAR
jgi:hypothetical protein